MSGAEKSRLYGEILINPEEALKSIKSSQERRLFLRKGWTVDAFNEMEQAGAFLDVELDDAALASRLSKGWVVRQDDTVSAGY